MDDEQVRLGVVTAMRPTLFVRLHTDIAQVETAVHDYSVDVVVEWSPDRGPDVDLDELSLLSGVDTGGYLPELVKSLPPQLRIPVGEGSLVVADLSSSTCLHELAMRGMDLALVGEALLGENMDMKPLREAYDVTSPRVLIANSMRIDPSWRGAQYGLLAMDMVIRRLHPGVPLAALYPMEPGLTDLDARMAANRGLAKYWGKIGFVDFDGIMVRDLASEEEGSSSDASQTVS